MLPEGGEYMFVCVYDISLAFFVFLHGSEIEIGIDVFMYCRFRSEQTSSMCGKIYRTNINTSISNLTLRDYLACRYVIWRISRLGDPDKVIYTHEMLHLYGHVIWASSEKMYFI